VIALLLLVQAPASAPSIPPARGSIRAGNEAFARGDLAAARAEYEASLRRDPDSPAALHNLGLVRLRERSFEEARANLERARASGDEEVRFKSAYHIGHALFRESEAAEAEPDGLPRAIALARAARESFLDAIERRDDPDARANVELASRRLERLEKKEEERKKESESRPSSQPSGESPPESQPSSESRPSDGSASRPSPEADSRPSEEGPESRPESRPLERPASRPESRPASRPAGRPESRPAIPPEKARQILDRLAELEKEREALEARVRRAERVRVERDW
jgi:tetratricopeptide (TPR) repeat protein